MRLQARWIACWRLSVSLIRSAALAALLSLSLLAPVAAREVTDAERAALAETISSFDAAMRANDMERIMGTIPPKMLDAMAAQFGVTIEELIAAAAQQMQQAMANVLLVSFGMNLEAATYAELADGMPYVLIPTETVMEIPGTGKIRAVSDTLGIIEEGAWYLLRVDASQLPLLHRVYPGFADVELSPGTMEAVE
jgi:hypothetical protein